VTTESAPRLVEVEARDLVIGDIVGEGEVVAHLISVNGGTKIGALLMSPDGKRVVDLMRTYRVDEIVKVVR
jgi:hypothetical protein